MSRYITFWDDFDVDTIATNAVGFTTRGTVAPNGWAPAYGTPAVKNRFLNYKTNSSNIPMRNTVTWDTIDADANRANVELLSCFAKDAVTAANGTLFARGVGASGAAATEGYLAICEMAGNIYISKRTGAFTIATIATAAFTFSAGKSYFVRFRVVGTSLQLRVWDSALGMAGEPTTWNISTTDATFGANGWVGLGGYDAAADKIFPWNFLSVGTNSDTAPCPRTNAEVDAAISSQSAVLAVVMQITAVGYNAGVSPYTKQIKAYFSTFGFASRPWDNPPNQYFPGLIAQIPTVSREMSTALAGQVATGIGDAVLMNPPQGDTRKGILDDLLRLVPKRNIVLMQVGCFDHPLHDFRPIVRGRVGNATAPTEETIRLPIADLSDALNEPLSTTRFGASGSNPNQGQFYPAMFGQPQYVECPLIDSANLRYALNRRAIIQQTPVSTGGGPSMFADTTALSSSSTISAVTPASDLLTSAVAHGMTANWRVVFFLGTPPAPLALETEYWVISSGLTTSDFKVSATRGGSAIDITGSTTGANWIGFGYDFDYTGPPASVRLANTPASSTTRIFAQAGADNDGSATPYLPGKMYASILFSALGLSLNFKDQTSFDALDTALSTFKGGLWFDTQLHTGAEAALKLATGSFTFFCLSPEGLFQVGKIDLPAATAVLTLIESDVKDGSLKLVDVIRPVDMSKAQFTYSPWFLLGPPLQTDAIFGARQGKSTQLPYSYGAASTPLDNFPNNTEANNAAAFDSIDVTGGIEMRNRIAALFLKKLGVFEVQTRVAAARLSIGQTISLTHPRMGWKQWTSGDPASPDNTATIDNRLAVVVGVKTNWSAPDEFNTTLKLLRQMPGNYPTANFN